MWLMSANAYLSAVQDWNQGDMLFVRARDFESIKYLCDNLPGFDERSIKRSPEADYPYRMHVTRRQYAKFVGDEAMKISYFNFKSEATKRRGHEYHSFLMRVWSLSHMLTSKTMKRRQDEADRAKRNRYPTTSAPYTPPPAGSLAKNSLRNGGSGYAYPPVGTISPKARRSDAGSRDAVDLLRDELDAEDSLPEGYSFDDDGALVLGDGTVVPWQA